MRAGHGIRATAFATGTNRRAATQARLQHSPAGDILLQKDSLAGGFVENAMTWKMP
jgi:hypothetical protein